MNRNDQSIRKQITHLIQQYEDGHLIDMPLSQGGLIDTLEALARSIAEQVAERLITPDERVSNLLALATAEKPYKAGIRARNHLRTEQRQALPKILDDIFDTKGDV